MRILMTDTFKHIGKYPRYTLALSEHFHEDGHTSEIPVLIRQYGEGCEWTIASVYDSLEHAYESYHIMIDADQPFIPELDRKQAG